MVNCKHNKRFKTDSQRSAVLVLIGFSVYGAIFECCGSVAHHLSGRYEPRTYYTVVEIAVPTLVEQLNQ
ncbi:hypothetical protein DXJ83_24795 [Vibrio parahaemolyticus]|nr:hypothetical protein DXJ83_24795 [Vibrio parahaemolyticus]